MEADTEDGCKPHCGECVTLSTPNASYLMPFDDPQCTLLQSACHGELLGDSGKVRTRLICCLPCAPFPAWLGPCPLPASSTYHPCPTRDCHHASPVEPLLYLCMLISPAGLPPPWQSPIVQDSCLVRIHLQAVGSSSNASHSWASVSSSLKCVSLSTSSPMLCGCHEN